ncbi:MAG: hypothetical protein HYT39_03045 [Candidatus Sungbacteria bacterium]|nr:hypothetical protein [Candidatus Sungbacteria bacterium]
MNVLGLKIAGHDTGACLISDGKVIAIAEERLNRVKHSHNMFPVLAIPYCLEALGIKPEEVDLVVIDQIDTRKNAPMKQWLLEHTGAAFSKARIEIINHHDAHAASAFFCSPFEEAAVLVYDGAGEKFENHLGVAATETETMYVGRGNRLYQIQKTTHLREGKIFPYTFGIGKLYSLISERYIGLGKYNEGKMMGLAPYGNDSILKQFPASHWYAEKYGHILCNPRITFPSRSYGARLKNKSLREIAEVARNILRMKLRLVLRPMALKLLKVSGVAGERLTEPHVFDEIRLPRPPREKSEKLPDDYYASVAYAAQKVLEEVAVSWGIKLRELTNIPNLCVAGGVGLNIDANKNFLDKAGFKKIFIQPGCSDTGVALGCALYGWHMILDRPRFWKMQNAALGRGYSEKEITEAISKVKDRVNAQKSPNVSAEAAKLMAEKKIIGWFQGGAEYGPRALGNRSILCDPRPEDAKDILNNRVKHREPWRPFAAAVLREKMSEWFELLEESPFMLLAALVVPEKRRLVPSIVHVDGTCRIQSVTKEANGRYYELINEFAKITGVPLILNTSFNLAGDPIIETPEDALGCFLATEMDYLVIENFIISKKPV